MAKLASGRLLGCVFSGLGLLALSACAAGTEDAAGGGGGGGGKVVEVPFKGLNITDVDLFQTIEVPLFDQGAPVTGSPPIVAGKQALLRISFTVDEGLAARNAQVKVSFESGSQDPTEIVLTQQVIANSAPDVLDSALIVPIDGEKIASDTAIRVQILEVDPKAKVEGTKGLTTFPESGSYPLGAQSVGNPTKIVFVPIVYNGDGSGRLPDTSEAQIALYTKRVLSMYPTPSLDVSIGNPWTWSQQVQASGNGWDTILNAFANAHHGGGSSVTTYYYGLFSPASNFSNYCQGGCVTGLSFVAGDPSDSFARSSVSLGFSGPVSVDTVTHELGHAHGFNGHAPCGGAQGINPNFPYNDGGIGVFGLDVAELAYKNPDNFTDIMSYCDDNWVSDFTWSLLFERTRAVGMVNADMVAGAPQRWQSISVAGDGSMKPLSSALRTSPPGRVNVRVQALDARNRVVAEVSGIFLSFDHLAGGVLRVPEVVGATHFAVIGEIE